MKRGRPRNADIREIASADELMARTCYQLIIWGYPRLKTFAVVAAEARASIRPHWRGRENPVKGDRVKQIYQQWLASNGLTSRRWRYAKHWLMATRPVAHMTIGEAARHLTPAVCYLVGFDTDMNEWYGVCEITEGYVEPNHDRWTKHNEVVYWGEDGVEKHSKLCTIDCPAQPPGKFDTYYLNGGSIPVYVVGTDPHNGVIGGNGVIPGTAMLIMP